jgi:hypothetical protein
VTRYLKNEAVGQVLAAANAALEVADLPRTTGSGDARELPLVYIVGVPRSGTTLAHQLVVRHLDVGYVDNVIARFWLRPSVGLALSRSLQASDERPDVGLTSRHGVTTGLAGPHEFGYFWRHWLRLDESPTHHLDAAAQARVDVDGLGRTIRDELLGPSGKTFVFKNVICGFHARLLTRAHPASLFIHVTRDLGACARSVLHARRERYDSYEAWWSLKPSAYPFDAPTPAAEVVRQVRDCRAEIADELAAPTVRALELGYDELCLDPRGALERIRTELARLGNTVPPPFEPIAQLGPSQGLALPPEVEFQLAKALEPT